MSEYEYEERPVNKAADIAEESNVRRHIRRLVSDAYEELYQAILDMSKLAGIRTWYMNKFHTPQYAKWWNLFFRPEMEWTDETGTAYSIPAYAIRHGLVAELLSNGFAVECDCADETVVIKW